MARADEGVPGARSDPTLQAATHQEHWASFYDSFDRLVHETSSRSADLLRQAMLLPALADRELAEARAEAARRLTDERNRRRSVLALLQADLDGSRRRTELLASSIAGLASLANDVLADVAHLSRRVAQALAELDADTGAVLESDAGAKTVAPAVTPPTPEPAVERPAAGARGWAWESDAAPSRPAAPSEPATPSEPAERDDGAMAAGSVEEPVAGATIAEPSGGLRTVELVVRGARPTSALSLQRYLATLDHVANAEVRDYSADVLRIEVQVERALTAADLLTWDTGAGLEIISLTDEIIEVRLADPLRSPKLLPPRERSSA